MVDKIGWLARWQNYRASKGVWFWSCVACAIATIFIGFVWGGWVTGGTATQMAQTAAGNARAKLAAAICVERFEHSSTAAVALASLKKTHSWDRSAILKKDGWATMPGMHAPVSGAASLCAHELLTAKLPKAKAKTG